MPKKIKIKVRRGKFRKYKIEEIEAEKIGDRKAPNVFAIHETLRKGKRHRRTYSITHIPTGMKVAEYKQKGEAVRDVKRLFSLNADWNSFPEEQGEILGTPWAECVWHLYFRGNASRRLSLEHAAIDEEKAENALQSFIKHCTMEEGEAA